jgi:hypothetical protein
VRSATGGIATSGHLGFRLAGILLKLVSEPGLHETVLCGHGEQIGQLVTHLADRGLLDAAPPRWAKGSTWLL